MSSRRRRPTYRPARRQERRWGVGRIVGTVLVTAILGAAVVGAAIVIPSFLKTPGERTGRTGPSPSPEPSCAPAKAAAGSQLGTVVWIEGDALRLYDLDTCERRTVVDSDVQPPVRFSPDGEWLGFGDGAVVAVSGGDVLHPLGRLERWAWGPDGDTLAGVTDDGRAVLGNASGHGRTLVPSGAEHLAFSPDGSALAFDVDGSDVVVAQLSSGRTSVVYRAAASLHASPHVVAWSPDGDWILFWRLERKKAGVPLDAVPAHGGPWVNVFTPSLPFDDFVSTCGDTVVLAGGGKREASVGQQVLEVAPPWKDFTNLSVDFDRSWMWPSCSPDGRWIVATASANARSFEPGFGVRSLWVLPHGEEDGKRTRLTQSENRAFEAPRWSGDGRFVLFVARDQDPSERASLLLLPFDPRTGKPGKSIGVGRGLGPANVNRGHLDWLDRFDWYRPA